MATIAKCFSGLVAAGKGDRCIKVKKILYHTLLRKLDGTSLISIHRYGQKAAPVQYQQIASILGRQIIPLLSGIESKYKTDFKLKKQVPSLPIKVNPDNLEEIECFRQILELSLRQGTWNGDIFND